MAKLLKIIVTALVLVIISLAGLFVYLGGFMPVMVEERTLGPYLMAYREIPVVKFSEVGEITTALNRDLRDLGLTDFHPFDLFYPDQRAEIGFIITSGDEAKVQQASSPIKLRVIPAQSYLTANFPWKTSLSYLVGYMKVDMALTKYRDEHGFRKTWAATEHLGDSIRYLQPIEKE